MWSPLTTNLVFNMNTMHCGFNVMDLEQDYGRALPCDMDAGRDAYRRRLFNTLNTMNNNGRWIGTTLRISGDIVTITAPGTPLRRFLTVIEFEVVRRSRLYRNLPRVEAVFGAGPDTEQTTIEFPVIKLKAKGRAKAPDGPKNKVSSRSNRHKGQSLVVEKRQGSSNQVKLSLALKIIGLHEKEFKQWDKNTDQGYRLRILRYGYGTQAQGKGCGYGYRPQKDKGWEL
ncbi:hypothetical protein B0O80DRAFT_429629 [Mortierella sp. GBAus27b]|nr:hypothetical protein B0O80DRAFT_429629 [Mortierella sp. GBAus27b]